MKMKAGFSVIECLVYCFLFCVLCVLMFNWVGASQVSLAKIEKKSRNILERYAALDSFIHDALSAPAAMQAWKKITETEIIWQSKEGSIGWVWDGAALYRYAGMHDGVVWKHAHKSLASNSLARVAFTVHKNKHNEIVSVTGSFDETMRKIVLPNRSIDENA